MKSQIKNKFYIVFFLSVTVLAFFFPPSADDLGWATSDGMKLLQNGFADYNGRYLGNISAVFLTRIPYVLPFIKGFALTAILFLIQKMTANKSKDFLYLSAILLLVPSPLFIQGFVWTAGFSNYYLSALVIMVNLYIVFYKHERTVCRVVLILFLGIAGQLFMETYTLFSLTLSVFAVIYFAVKDKKADVVSITYFLSCVFGAVIMFLNGVYSKVMTGENTYQALSGKSESFFQSILNLLQNLFSVVLKNALTSCFPAIIIITVICLVKMKKSKNVSRKVNCAVMFSLFLSLLSAVFAGIAFLKYHDISKVKLFSGFILLFVLLTCAIIIFNFFENEKQKRVFFYFSMILILTLPLCAVFPVGARCFVGAYIILIMIIRELYESAGKDFLTKVLNIACAALFVVNLACYIQVYVSNTEKVEYIKSEVEKGNKVIEVEHTKFKFLVYSMDIEDKAEKYERRFCEYYDLPADTEIEYK